MPIALRHRKRSIGSPTCAWPERESLLVFSGRTPPTVIRLQTSNNHYTTLGYSCQVSRRERGDEGREVETHDAPFWSASDGHDYTTKSGLKSKCLGALWLFHRNSEGLLVLIGWPRDGFAFLARTIESVEQINEQCSFICSFRAGYRPCHARYLAAPATLG